MLLAESFFFSPYTLSFWLFPNQPLNMAPVLLPEDLTYLFNEATILQLSHQLSPPFQTNPWFRRPISLSSKKTLLPWPLDFDSSCILTSYRHPPLTSVLKSSCVVYWPAGHVCWVSWHHWVPWQHTPHRTYHLSQPLPVWLSPTCFLMAAFPHSHLVTTEGWE